MSVRDVRALLADGPARCEEIKTLNVTYFSLELETKSAR